MASSLASVIIPVTAKVMVSPAPTSAIAWRKLPAPLSLRLATT